MKDLKNIADKNNVILPSTSMTIAASQSLAAMLIHIMTVGMQGKSAGFMQAINCGRIRQS